MGIFLGTQTCTAILVLISGSLAWAAPKRTAIDQQFASIKAQRESLQKQLTTARATRLKPVVVSPPAPLVAIASISPPAPIAALEPITPLQQTAPSWDCPSLASR